MHAYVVLQYYSIGTVVLQVSMHCMQYLRMHALHVVTYSYSTSCVSCRCWELMFLEFHRVGELTNIMMLVTLRNTYSKSTCSTRSTCTVRKVSMHAYHAWFPSRDACMHACLPYTKCQLLLVLAFVAVAVDVGNSCSLEFYRVPDIHNITQL